MRRRSVSEKQQEYVEPLEDWLVVKRDEEGQRQSKGGIILPDETRARQKPMRGVVLAVGPGKTLPDGKGRFPMPVKPGDELLYRQYSGDRIGQYLGLE
jgi:chaperonin GroES